jgi:hypothetical protein
LQSTAQQGRMSVSSAPVIVVAHTSGEMASVVCVKVFCSIASCARKVGCEKSVRKVQFEFHLRCLGHPNAGKAGIKHSCHREHNPIMG